jgi:hypothetical protein
MRSPIISLGLIASLCSCAGGSPVGPGTQTFRILFIGNSLTYVNDLPHTVVQLAASAGDSIEVESVAYPNYALIDHVHGPSDAIGTIRSRQWDYVVLQQGPSSLPLSRDTLVVATKLLDPEIRAVGARPAELMVWPAKEDFAVFDQVLGSYLEAAQTVDGVFLPAGEAWRAAWAIDPSLPLYGLDDFHPSEVGTFLAALVVYEGITGRDVRTLAPDAFAAGHRLNLSAGTIRVLQRAAHETVVRYAAAEAR